MVYCHKLLFLQVLECRLQQLIMENYEIEVLNSK